MRSIQPTLALTLLLTLIGCSVQAPSPKADAQQEKTTDKTQPVTTTVTTTTVTTNKSEQLAQQVAPRRANNKVLVKTMAAKFNTPQRAKIYHMAPPPIIEHPSENYQPLDQNPIQVVAENPVSTFSIDVDTGSYSNMRRMINQGVIPINDAIRLEELINYFDYHYPTPTSTKQPFTLNTEMMLAPWNKDRVLLKVGLKGYEVDKAQLGNANLVFLLDVSGSMNAPNKLPLLKKSLIMLTSQLDKNDRVSIVVYAGAAGVVLEPTPGNDYQSINNAINKLSAGGSTHGSQGIELAYQLAQKSFIKDGINRVILATDGDFNVGTSNIDALKKLIEQKKQLGIGLTTLGFGQGNYNDYLMEQLADVGDGNYAYIDNINEARKVLVDQLTSTMQIIAKDVKIQLEFNPNVVAQYRLIGYENRQLKREDFNNDKVDAGDIGAGHDVTAIYELTMIDAKNKGIDPLHYQQQKITQRNMTEIGLIKLRYKQPKTDNSLLISQSIELDLLNNPATKDFKFASAVAAFGQLIKGGKYMEKYHYQDIIKLANQTKGLDQFGYRSEFINLVRTMESLTAMQNKTREHRPSIN